VVQHRKGEVAFEAIDEAQPGAKWRALLERFWPSYERWFLSEGERARPGYVTSSRELRTHMPELVPTFERLVGLAGDRDVVARFLASYCPPTYLLACSQAVWSRDECVLVRNYDYSPAYCEGVVLRTAWNGRRVVAMSDCLWGVLDGMNEDGLAVSLSFGGRRTVGRGFGVPLVLRYVLEFCSTTDDAVSVLERVPVHMAYNVTVLDRAGRYVTAYLRPDEPALVRAVPCAANHQQEIEWVQHAKATATLERERFLFRQLQDPAQDVEHLIDAFLHPPLYSRAFDRGHGTLYTAVYKPASPGVELRWPGSTWTLPLDPFTEGRRSVRLD
jgi:predicted choloylglycine hydrolase